MIYFCCDDTKRRNAVKAHPTLNGIDFLEVLDDHDDPFEERQRTLFVHFIDKDTVQGDQSLATLLSNLKPENLLIEGGERIKDIFVTDISSDVSSPPSSPPQPANSNRTKKRMEQRPSLHSILDCHRSTRFLQLVALGYSGN